MSAVAAGVAAGCLVLLTICAIVLTAAVVWRWMQ